MRRVLIPQALATAAGPLPRGPVEVWSGRTMGTTWSVRIAGADSRDTSRLRDGIHRELAQLVADLSHWEPGSALCRFNGAPAGSHQVLPPNLYTVLDAALTVARRTGGAFDPTLGPLVDLWGFGPPGPVAVPPSPAAVKQARARCGWQHLILDPERRSAYQPGGLRLDLSGIAKGYAVDKLSALLSREGARHHLVEIGGELLGAGLKPDGTPWWIQLETPEQCAAGIPETVAALHGLGIATSGEYRRGFSAGARRYSHSIDLSTGEPIATDLVLVSVLHPECMLADAYATALLVAGPVHGPALAETLRLASRFVLARLPHPVDIISHELEKLIL